MTLLDIGDLQEHPINHKIYFTNQEEDEELLESIKLNGIQDPLVITQDGRIISGHRRYKAACKLGLHTVPVVSKVFKNLDDELQYLIQANMYRSKSMEEKVREGQQLKDILIRKGEKSRDSVGSHLGVSGRTFAKAERVVETIDAIQDTDPEQAERLRARLNKSVDGAYKEAIGQTDDIDVAEEMEAEVMEEAAGIEEKRKYYYLDDLMKLTAFMQVIYDKLRKGRNSTTPESVGFMVGNIFEMKERLMTWFPTRMEQCIKCGGTGQIHLLDQNVQDTVVKCPVCVDGKTGMYKASSK